MSLLLAIAAPAAPRAAPSPAEARRIAHEQRIAADERASARLFDGPPPVTHADSLAHARALLRAVTAGFELEASVDSARRARAARAVALFERLDDAPPTERALALMLHGRAINADADSLDRQPYLTALALLDGGTLAEDTLAARVHQMLARELQAVQADHEALPHYQQVHALFVRHYGERHPDAAESLAELAVGLDQVGRYEECMAAVRRSLALFDSLGMPLHPARRTAVIIASGFTTRDQLDELLALRHEALRISEAALGEGSRDYQVDLINLAVALMDFGDFAGARQLMARGLPWIERSFGSRSPVTNNLRQQLAIASFQVGDTATARRLLQESARIVSETNRGSLGTALRWQAELLQREGRAAESARLAAQAYSADSVRRNGPTWPLARSLMVQMQAHEMLGDTTALRATLARLLALADADEHWRTGARAMLCEWRSRTALRCGDTTGAWHWASEAVRVSREQTAWLIRSLPDARALQLARQNTRFLQLMAAQADSPERAASLWDAIVRERGSVRSELTRRRLPAQWRSDTALVQRHARWSAAQRALAAFLVDRSVTSLDSSAAVRLGRLRREVEAAESELAARGAATPADTGAAALAVLRAALGADEALVGMHVRFGGTDSAEVVAMFARDAAGALGRVVLGRADSLAALVAAWRERLAEPPGGSIAAARRTEAAARRAGERVRVAVWQPLAAALPGVRVVHLVADGPLVDLPWAALPTGDSGYLVEQSPEIRVLEAERELLRERPEADAAATLLALGAPDFGRAARPAAVREGADVCAEARPVFGALPATSAEVVGIAERWSPTAQGAVTVRVGPAATEAAFRAEAPGRTVVHVATHGFVAGDVCRESAPGLRGVGGVGPVRARRHSERTASPERRAPATPWMDRRVWLALAGANHRTPALGSRDDGMLTAEEVVTLDLSGTEWVVLSACHSAFSAGWARDGALGMRRAFRLAGARSVIASHWAVADEAALEWMQALYAARAAGHTEADEAVREASRQVLAARRASGRPTHPFHWAAFSASGR